MSGGSVELGFVLGAHACGADDMNDPGLSSELRIVQRGGRRGEIEHGIARGKNRQRIGGHVDPGIGHADQGARVRPKRVSALAFNRTGQRRAISFQYRRDEGPAHPAGCSDHRDPHVCHLIASRVLQASSPALLARATA